MSEKELNKKYIQEKTGLVDNDELIPIILEMIQESYKSGLSQAEYDNTMDLMEENERLKERIKQLDNGFMACVEEKCEIAEENEKLKTLIKQDKEKVEYLKSKIENKDSWCQLIADIGYDYDGYRQAESLMSLIDELVKYALYSRDDYDYEEFMLEGGNNE